MSGAFDRALKHTLGIEGGFSNNPKDSGGATRFGITEQLARAYGYDGRMQDLPLSLAVEIYRAEFWIPLRLDLVALEAESIALEVFDTAVNCGVQFAAESLQRSLNALNRGGTDFADMVVDGRVGPVTIAAFLQYLETRPDDGETILLRALNCIQGARYLELAEAREKDEEFLNGWLLNRVSI